MEEHPITALMRRYKEPVNSLIEDILTLDTLEGIHARLSQAEPVIAALYCERYLSALRFLESRPTDHGILFQSDYSAMLRMLLCSGWK